MKWIALVLLCASVAICDETVWNFDLSTLPDGWTSDEEWEFPGYGALTNIHANTPLEHIDTRIYTSSTVIPDGCDSIVLHCEQELSALANPYSTGAYSYVEIRYRYGDGNWYYIYNIGDVYMYTELIHIAIPVESSQSLQLYFSAVANAGGPYDPGDAWVDWLIFDLTLTVCGENLSLEPATWADVKGCF